MQFRKSAKQDIKKIMNMINQAQQYFKEKGIDQWQNHYPNAKVIEQDIDNGYSYVLVDQGKIIATAAISFNGEATYNEIYEGEWIKKEQYAVIHRVAVENSYKGQGVASHMFKAIEGLCAKQGVTSIRIDTHEENKSMQRLLEKCDFTYCGVIYLVNGDKRVAYQK